MTTIPSPALSLDLTKRDSATTYDVDFHNRSQRGRGADDLCPSLIAFDEMHTVMTGSNTNLPFLPFVLCAPDV